MSEKLDTYVYHEDTGNVWWFVRTTDERQHLLRGLNEGKDFDKAVVPWPPKERVHDGERFISRDEAHLLVLEHAARRILE